MQNKGLVITIAVLLTLASIFYLSFSVATSYFDSQAAKIKDPVAQQEYKDSVKYLGVYSYKNCLETQIGLGLDLKGGMNVILEISVPDVIENLADHKTDPAFVKSVNEARTAEEQGKGKFIDLFIDNYHKYAPGHKLAEVFATTQLQGKVNPQSTDAEVEKVLRQEVQSAIDNSFNVVRTRIDKFGVVQPNIQKLEGQEGRIMVEMPGIREPERMRKLLQGSANLEFWETYNSEEVAPYLSQIDARLAAGSSVNDTAKADTAKVKKQVAEAKSKATKFQLSGKNGKADIKSNSEQQVEAMKKQHPLLAMLQVIPGNSLSLVGYCNARDTAEVSKILNSSLAKQILPSDVKLLWSAKPTDNRENRKELRNVFELHALKVTTSNGRAPLEGDVITDAKDEFDQYNNPVVSMQMNSDGARRWAQLTKANVGKAIAIVLDGYVYSAPRVNGEIDGGNSQISGNFTIEDTKDLANTLKSGRMPAPAHIVQEEVVGPTLGAQSIQQGVWSFAVAFVLLICYMFMMYNLIPGLLANLALIFNVFFTLGILTSFQAALTLPGLAGMVLSLGTAVDANVLIYERIKEELRKGKGMKQAVKGGYDNAFSAIFDSNLTSLITGIILLSTGTGPIQGFATTWIIGILVSFFTAVYLTRLVYYWRLSHDHWTHVKFDTKVSRNFMQNTHFGFMRISRYTFILTIIGAIIFIGAIAIRGFDKSIDFTGGRNYVVQFDHAVEPEEVRPVIEKAFVNPDGTPSTTSALAIGTDGRTLRISTNYMIESTNPTVDDKAETILYNALKGAGLVSQKDINTFKNPDIRAGGSIVSSTKVGPSVASDITTGAIISVCLALIAIFLYILLRFRNVSFSLGSVIALAFDALTVLGFYALLHGVVPFSLEIDQTFIGAILTVIGYSINDKVVVFDRIRENLKLHPKQDKQSLFNDSINETLSRTINTSFSTLLVLLCIFFIGGASIRSFAFAMIIGVFFGTLSSIFIASPIAFRVMGGRIKDDGDGVAVGEETVVPAKA